MISRRGLIFGSGAVLCGAGLAPVGGLAATELGLPEDAGPRLDTVVSAPARGMTVAMTFDDGPHPTWTPKLLDILKARDIRTTFYVIGRNVATWPDIVKRMVDEGHEIGNHTWSHPFLSKLGTEGIFGELDRTSDAVYRAVQRIPVTLRPPYGALSGGQAATVHRDREMPTVMWSVDTQDWRRPGAEVVASRVIELSVPGSIVLSHDIHGPTIEAMPAALDGLIARGFDFATVSMILGRRDWSKIRWRLPQTDFAES
ncbi:MAG: polysaccharide deacetylase family protein [Maritimibacter sp.]|nr:polysaccharide deacetylase family protein [Maritimibacter sp.]